MNVNSEDDEKGRPYGDDDPFGSEGEASGDSAVPHAVHAPAPPVGQAPSSARLAGPAVARPLGRRANSSNDGGAGGGSAGGTTAHVRGVVGAPDGASSRRHGPPPSRASGFSDERYVGLGRLRTTGENPHFVRDYFRQSRLHFIGSFRARYEALMAAVAARLRVPASSLLAPPPPLSAAPAVFRRGGHENGGGDGSDDAGEGRDGTPPRPRRVIIHCDLDAFFASVAVVADPSLAGRPLAVCHGRGADGSAGEISSASYAARAAGVKAGMLFSTAAAMCPGLVAVPYDFAAYEAASIQLYTVFHSVAPGAVVEAVSVDEAYIDVSRCVGSGEALAAKLRAQIHATTGLRASAGIGSNKLLARLATAAAKPNGQWVLADADAAAYLATLPVRSLPGVGRSVAGRLAALGATTVGDVAALPRSRLTTAFGAVAGAALADAAVGRDDRSVAPLPPRRSVAAEISWGVRFPAGAAGAAAAAAFVADLAAETARRARDAGATPTRVTVKALRRAPGAGPPGKPLGCGLTTASSRSAVLPAAAAAPPTAPRVGGEGARDGGGVGSATAAAGEPNAAAYGAAAMDATAAAVVATATALYAAQGVPPEELRGVGVSLSGLAWCGAVTAAAGPMDSFLPSRVPAPRGEGVPTPLPPPHALPPSTMGRRRRPAAADASSPPAKRRGDPSRLPLPPPSEVLRPPLPLSADDSDGIQVVRPLRPPSTPPSADRGTAWPLTPPPPLLATPVQPRRPALSGSAQTPSVAAEEEDGGEEENQEEEPEVEEDEEEPPPPPPLPPPPQGVLPDDWDPAVFGALPPSIRRELLAAAQPGRRLTTAGRRRRPPSPPRPRLPTAPPASPGGGGSGGGATLVGRACRHPPPPRRAAAARKAAAQVTMTQVAAVRRGRRDGASVVGAAEFRAARLGDAIELLRDLGRGGGEGGTAGRAADGEDGGLDDDDDSEDGRARAPSVGASAPSPSAAAAPPPVPWPAVGGGDTVGAAPSPPPSPSIPSPTACLLTPPGAPPTPLFLPESLPTVAAALRTWVAAGPPPPGDRGGAAGRLLAARVAELVRGGSGAPPRRARAAAELRILRSAAAAAGGEGWASVLDAGLDAAAATGGGVPLWVPPLWRR